MVGSGCLSGLAASVLVAAPAVAGVTEYFVHDAFLTEVGQVSVFGFDELPAGDNVLTGFEYEDQGLVVIHRDGAPMNVLTERPNVFVDPCNFNSKPHVLSANFKNAPPYFTEEIGDNFDFVLTTPRQAAGLWIGNIFPGATGVEFLAADGSVLASRVFTDSHPDLVDCGENADNRLFYGVVSSTPIERIRTSEPPNDSDGIVYDDIQFGGAAGPPGDLDHDEDVDSADLNILLADFGCVSGACAGDIDGDGDTDSADLNLLLAGFGQSA